MRRKRVVAQLVVVAVVAISLGLLVGSGEVAQERPCAGDIAMFCGGVPVGGVRDYRLASQAENKLRMEVEPVKFSG